MTQRNTLDKLVEVIQTCDPYWHKISGTSENALDKLYNKMVL